ncbi:MAG: PH domain-containing protein [Gemmataceae bacterium]
MVAIQQHAVTGIVPPQTAEVRIREAWPSVAASGGIARLGRALTNTIFLAPLAWLMMSGVYFSKVMPFTARRYLLTNRRVAILRGWGAKVSGEVELGRIRDVKTVSDDNSDFFRAGNLEIYGAGSDRPLLVLPGVSEPENFRRAILQARDAWAPSPSA